MTLLSNSLQHLFSSSKTQQLSESEADKIMSYIKDLVNREDLIDDLIKKYEQANHLPFVEQESAFIPIYIGIEAFIIRNKPLIVKQEFTKDTLRESIRKKFDISALNPAFRLLFLPDFEQNMLLFEQGVQKLAYYVVSNIGPGRLTTAVASLKQEKVKEMIKIDAHGLQFESKMEGISDNEIKVAFQELY